ncbi:LYR motif-containing protein 2 isoform X2 [Neovison vison]|uniref:LYR motif-containing protein 2 isoform X2 n=1 Tax=Neovison vison TaxID=452646 RepID=UPI001CF0B0F7|nr:LYR motif-containing protein 2 isoform X2 [Neogale vison]
MATSRLPPATLTLKQFMRRQQVLLLYRRILQAIREVPNDSDRKYLKDWTREEFKRNKSATEENRSKKVISESDQHLKNVGEILQNAFLNRDTSWGNGMYLMSKKLLRLQLTISGFHLSIGQFSRN